MEPIKQNLENRLLISFFIFDILFFLFVILNNLYFWNSNVRLNYPVFFYIGIILELTMCFFLFKQSYLLYEKHKQSLTEKENGKESN